MPPRPPLRFKSSPSSSSLPPCTCRPTLPVARNSNQQQRLMSAAVESNPSPDLIPDFLCPNFGFFSRSLFAFSPPPPLPPPPLRIGTASAPDRARLRVIGTGWAGLGSVRRNGGALGAVNCACGRVQHSCLRCRATSTSAGPSAASEAVLDESIEGIDASSEPLEPPATSPPPPPPPPFVPPTLRPSPGQHQSLRRALAGSRRLLKLSGSRRQNGAPSSLAIGDWPARVQQVQGSSLLLWGSALNPLDQRGRPVILDDSEKLKILETLVDLSRILVRSVTPPPSASDDALLVFKRLQRDLERLHRAIGAAIAELLQKFQLGETGPKKYVKTQALLRIYSLSLQDQLPPVPSSPIPSIPTAFSQFEHDLVTLFRPAVHPNNLPSATPTHGESSPEWTSVEKSQQQALAIFLTTWEQYLDAGAEEAVRFVTGWKIQGKILDSQRYGRLLGRLSPSPSIWLDDSVISLPGDPKEFALHLIKHLSTAGSPLEALRILDLLDRRDVQLTEVVQIEYMTLILDGLLRGNFYEDSNIIARRLWPLVETFNSAPGLPSTQLERLVFDAYRMLAKAAAGQGRQGRVTQLLEKLKGLDPLEAAARRMAAASEAKDIALVRKIFDQVDKREASAFGKERLWGALVTAYVRVDDLDKGMKALLSMLKDDLQPKLALVNTLLSGYATRMDVDRTYTLFNRLPELSLKPNLVSYSILLALHSNLRDPDSVERVVEEMENAKISLDLTAWTTVMDVHVEVGNHTRALKIYSFLATQPEVTLKPDTAVFNVLLKATVLAGTPARTVLDLFRQGLDRGIRPNPQTYTTLMHAVCSAGLMDLAEELFKMMDLPPDSSSLPRSMMIVRPNAFIFATMISGYLQQNDTSKARAALNEMRARKLPISSVTYGIIVGSFLRPGMGDKGLALASSIAKAYIGAEAPPPRQLARPETFGRSLAQGKALLDVVGPLIVAYARRMQAAEALELFAKIVDLKNGPPSVAIYSALMDAYRRVGEIEDVFELWRRLSYRVLAYHGQDSVGGRRLISFSYRTVLCIPLTIVIDSLSQRNDTQLQIVRIWEQLSSEGYQFDASNWNSLAVAACRHNQLRRAFWIAENVLCRDEDELLEPSSYSVDFGRTPRVDSIPRTPSRLFDQRMPEQHLQRKHPRTIANLLSRPTETDAEFEPAILESLRLRRGMYWFPHAALLGHLDKGFMRLPRSDQLQEGEEDLRDVLRRDHPRTIGALARWRERLEVARRSK